MAWEQQLPPPRKIWRPPVSSKIKDFMPFFLSKKNLRGYRLKLFTLSLILLCMGTTPSVHAEDGYRLWLRYARAEDSTLRNSYRSALSSLVVPGKSDTEGVIRQELQIGLKNMLDAEVPVSDSIRDKSLIILSSPSALENLGLDWKAEISTLGSEGYLIRSVTVKNHPVILLAANSPLGCLYGAFHFLRLVGTGQSIENLDINEKPRVKLRVLDHWDNLDGSIERGYAGKSLWNWKELPDHVDSRLKDYARANASIGINGAVLNNVTSNPIFLSKEYLVKIAALASVFRAYGIKIYLSANFAAAKKIVALLTSHPL